MDAGEVRPTDEALAQAVARHERGALSALVERHHSRLLGYLYRLTDGDRKLAEDLVQETFLHLLRRISQYIYPRPFKPWLYAIATNLARDHYKSASARTSTATIEMLADQIPTIDQLPSTLEDNLSAEHEARRVAHALARLPDHQRETVILRYYEDLTLAEIAETLAIPLGTVKSRLSLGLKTLREMMQHESNYEP